MTQEYKELIFKSNGDYTWETDNGFLVKVGPNLTEVIYHREFDDLMDVLAHIQKISGCRPVFTLDEYTANNGISMAIEKKSDQYDEDGDKPKAC